MKFVYGKNTTNCLIQTVFTREADCVAETPPNLQEHLVTAIRIPIRTTKGKIEKIFYSTQMITDLWSILNVRCKGENERFNDPRRAPFDNPSDERLQKLLDFAEICDNMQCKRG